MCQLLKERGDEREKKSEEQSRNVKERWGGETGVDGAKIRWRTGTGSADLVLSSWMKFPLKLLSNLAWGGRRTGIQEFVFQDWKTREKGGVVAGATADLEHPNCSQRVSSAPRGALLPSGHTIQCKINVLCL